MISPQERFTTQPILIISIEQNLKYSYINSFGVSRGNDFWYFDYYARDDKL